MGSACTKSDAEGIIDDERAVDLEKEDINEDEKNGVDLVDAKKTEKGDSESIMSTSSGSSRPPTPFSRPVTATVIQRHFVEVEIVKTPVNSSFSLKPCLEGNVSSIPSNVPPTILNTSTVYYFHHFHHRVLCREQLVLWHSFMVGS